MPRSLSSRCHTQHPLQKPFCSLQHHDEAVLKMPRAFHWSLQRHQPLKPPRSKKKPFPSYGRERWSRKSSLQETAGASVSQGEKEDEGNQIPDISDVLPTAGQHQSWWQWSCTPHLLLHLRTKSLHPGTPLRETHSIFDHCWVTQPQQRRNLKYRVKQSRFEHMRLGRSVIHSLQSILLVSILYN